MKTISHILIIILAAALVAGAFALIVEYTSLFSSPIGAGDQFQGQGMVPPDNTGGNPGDPSTQPTLSAEDSQAPVGSNGDQPARPEWNSEGNQPPAGDGTGPQMPGGMGNPGGEQSSHGWLGVLIMLVKVAVATVIVILVQKIIEIVREKRTTGATAG